MLCERCQAVIEPWGFASAFATFWDELLSERVPRPVHRAAALTAFRRRITDEATLVAMTQALANYRASRRVRDGFVMDASTWIRDWDSWLVTGVDAPAAVDPIAAISDDLGEADRAAMITERRKQEWCRGQAGFGAWRRETPEMTARALAGMIWSARHERFLEFVGFPPSYWCGLMDEFDAAEQLTKEGPS